MTNTQTDTRPAGDQALSDATGVATASLTLSYVTLRNLLSGALVAAGKDATRPALCAVRLEWSDTEVTAVATDNYRLAWGAYKIDPRDDRLTTGAVVLPRALVESVVKALPKTYKGPRTLGTNPFQEATITVAGDTVVVSWRSPDGEGSVTGTVLAAEFPKWRSLTSPEPADTQDIAFNPAYMADVAKLPHDKHAPARWTFSGPTRPAVARYGEFEGVTWSYLLMPVRLTA